MHPLTEPDLRAILQRALGDADRGLAALRVHLDDADLDHLARAAGGDARVALSTLEAAASATDPDPAGDRRITRATLIEALGRARFGYDKGGEDHYNLASALIKSLRNSDVNAGLYWLARLIEGGADPVFIARRLCILASEDVGLADPQAMVQAAAAAQIVQLIGLPEGLYPLAQATVYLARAPKSDALKRGYFAAAEDAAATAREPIPFHLRNAVDWPDEGPRLRSRAIATPTTTRMRARKCPVSPDRSWAGFTSGQMIMKMRQARRKPPIGWLKSLVSLLTPPGSGFGLCEFATPRIAPLATTSAAINEPGWLTRRRIFRA